MVDLELIVYIFNNPIYLQIVIYHYIYIMRMYNSIVPFSVFVLLLSSSLCLHMLESKPQIFFAWNSYLLKQFKICFLFICIFDNCHICTFQFYLFLSIELTFHLPSVQMTFFATSCVVLLKFNSSNFSISEKVFTLPSFLKIFSLDLEFRLKVFSLVS